MDFLKKPLTVYLLLFLSTTLFGALLLYLPATGKQYTSFIDAFFVASSAFTVTGLSTVDITTQFNWLGDIIIMFLIQIGGLGIVTITTLTLIIANRRISMHERKLIMVTWNVDEPGGMVRLIRQLTLYSITTEFIGMLLLALSFVPKYGFGKGIFISMFTAVSAFNNAGFALFSKNMIGFNDDPVVTLIIPILIIMGGLGPLVMSDLIRTRRLSKLKLHTKVAVTTTLALIAIGTAGYFLLEYTNTLRPFNIWAKIGTSFFQSVTTRTAGFQSVDLGLIHTPTAIMMMILMFIGGAPFSAAGGIKVTTFIVVLMFVYSTLRDDDHTTLFNRTIKPKTIAKAITVTSVSLIFVLTVTFIVSCLNETTPFIKVIFEVVSAFGTVGLSMNFTTEYHTLTKAIIIIVMICGKLGVVTVLALFIPSKKRFYQYAKGNIYL
ncbi:TrkH family potassium uptake protein [Staphylococcus simulans]|uniref:TrkH family potassium uptake protein n=1 Tax=Staphylococcus simulans TaxID=1286 RepID=UPI000D02EE49|nr:potassium transporter TrkG [Staphylococcus simulans]MCD8914212.1 TrkH family potassium uptake protein [Staphylococcus simulans]